MKRKSHVRNAPTVVLDTVEKWMLYTRWCDEYQIPDADAEYKNVYLDLSHIGMVGNHPKMNEELKYEESAVFSVEKLQTLLKFARALNCEQVRISMKKETPLCVDFGKDDGLFKGWKGFLGPRTEE